MSHWPPRGLAARSANSARLANLSEGPGAAGASPACDRPVALQQLPVSQTSAVPRHQPIWSPLAGVNAYNELLPRITSPTVVGTADDADDEIDQPAGDHDNLEWHQPRMLWTFSSVRNRLSVSSSSRVYHHPATYLCRSPHPDTGLVDEVGGIGLRERAACQRVVLPSRSHSPRQYVGPADSICTGRP